MTPLIAHTSEGAGEPVVLLNGGFMTMKAWDPIAAPLAADYRIVRCDFRGQLMSPGDAPPTLDGHADDVVAVLDRLDIGAAHVVGVSFGAFVGIVMAARRPARVRSLVAACATDRFTDADWTAGLPVVEACRAAAEGKGDGGLLIDLLAPATYSPAFLDANRALMAQRRALVSSLPPGYFAGHRGILAALEGLDLGADAAATRCPALVLAGGGDRTFPLERSRALARLIPGAALEVIDGAPHGVVIEDPRAVLARVGAFLNRVRSGTVSEHPHA